MGRGLIVRPELTHTISVGELNEILVTIELPAQLITSQNKTINFTQQLTGTTEIITEDLRSLERFFFSVQETCSV